MMTLSHSLSAGLVAVLLTSSLPLAAWSAPASSIETAQVPSTAPVIYVNPSLGTDTPTGGGSTANSLRTITYALQRAQPGTVIQLAAGSYTRDTGEVFPLTIGQNIRIQGDTANNGSTVLIIGGGTFNSPTFGGQNATLRALNNAEIRGVTVTNPNTRGTGIWLEAGSAQVQNSTFTNSLREGIFVTGSATPTIANNVFSQNRGNGISIVRSASGEVRNNTFDSTGFGIAVSDNATPTLRGNQVTNNLDGIVIGNSARPVLRDNTIENNTRDGIVAVGTAQPDLGTAESPGGNTLRNNGRHDLYNQTRGIRLVAIGNQIDPSRIEGEVALTSPGSSQFGDVAGNWAEAYITALADREIISGFPDGTFRPNDPVTRAQFAAIVNKAFSPQPKRSSINFNDVSSSFWGRQAIQTAYRGGFLTGYPGQVFRPDERIPRVQVLVSLVSGLQLSTPSSVNLDTYFQDSLDIPTWAQGSIAAATQRQIVVNYPSTNQLAPNREATRAEVAAFIYQALVSAGQAQPLSSPYVVTP